MNVTMSDGRNITLTRITSTLDQQTAGKLRTPPKRGRRITIWQAETPRPVFKISGSFPRVLRGFGPTPEHALARLYDELEDAGELDQDASPCLDCGGGYRILSVAQSYVQHNDKCPAMNDRQEET